MNLAPVLYPRLDSGGLPALFGLEAAVGELEGAAVFGDGAHDVLGCSVGDVGLDLQRDPDLCADNAHQVLDDAVGDGVGVLGDVASCPG